MSIMMHKYAVFNWTILYFYYDLWMKLYKQKCCERMSYFKFLEMP